MRAKSSAAPLLALLLVLLSYAAQASEAMRVIAIKVAGKALANAQYVEVDLILPGAGVAKKVAIRLAHSMAIGTEVITPARTQIELESANGNRITIEPVTRCKINAVTPDGESYSISSGTLAFKVSRALSFFHVNYEKFLAIVRGTQFLVSVEPAKQIRFRLSEGRLLVEREARVRIQESDSIAALRVPEILAEGRKTEVSYRLDVEEYLREFKTLKEAEDYYRDKLREDEQSGDPERMLDGLNAMGVILHLLGKDQEALTFLERGLTLTEQRADKRTAAIFANNLGAVHQRLGQLERTIARQELAIKYRMVLYPDGLHSDIAGSHNNLGAAYFAQGKYDDAAKHFETSLALQRRLYEGDLHPGIAQLYNNLGILERTRGRFKEAQAYHQRALEVLLKLYPREHPSVAGTYTKLGAASATLRDYPGAIKLHEKAIAILRKLYPSELHPEIADNYTNLGAIYAAQDKPERSAAQHRKALEIRRKLYPQSVHPSLALSHANLGAALVDARKFQEALGDLREALRQHASLYPNGMHIDVALNRTNLGAALAGLQNYAAAMVEYETALDLWRRLFKGEDHPGTAITLDRLGSALLAINEPKKAIERHEQALAMRLRLYPDGVHRSLAASYRELSKDWKHAGNQAKANEYERKQRDVDSRIGK